MTSASELFYNRRSRAGRSLEPEQGFDPHPFGRDSGLFRHPIRRRALRRLHRREDCDPSRQFAAGTPQPQARRHLCHRSFQTDRESVRLDNSSLHDSETGNSSSDATASSRVNWLTLARNDQLPGSVLQARARLLERLRSISRMRNRQNVTASPISWDEFSVGDDFGFINSGNWEAETREQLESSVQFDLASEVNQAWSLQNASKKKPLGLTQEAICSLPHEHFEGGEEGDGLTSSLLECSICLERFWTGDKLIRLGCNHLFHPACLEPWVRTCGDCPYCRASV